VLEPVDRRSGGGLPVSAQDCVADAVDQGGWALLYTAPMTEQSVRRPKSIVTIVAMMVLGYSVTIASSIWVSDGQPAIVVITLALVFALAYAIWRGRPFSRWVLTVLVVGQIVSTIVLYDGFNGLWLIRAILPVALAGLLWMPMASRHWFTASYGTAI
jgi:hypothetical protein